MTKIDSAALTTTNRMLGLAGGSASAQTVLNDGDVTQTLDVIPVARRSLAPGANGGIFFGVMQNVHTAAGAVATVSDVYNMGGLNNEPFPQPVPRSLDLWLLRMSLSQTGTAARFTSAFACVRLPATMQGFSQNQAGAAVSATAYNMTVAEWDQVHDGVGQNSKTLQHSYDLGMRLSPQTELYFESAQNGVGAVTATLVCLLGLFPIGTGQDVV